MYSNPKDEQTHSLENNNEFSQPGIADDLIQFASAAWTFQDGDNIDDASQAKDNGYLQDETTIALARQELVQRQGMHEEEIDRFEEGYLKIYEIRLSRLEKELSEEDGKKLRQEAALLKAMTERDEINTQFAEVEKKYQAAGLEMAEQKKDIVGKLISDSKVKGAAILALDKEFYEKRQAQVDVAFAANKDFYDRVIAKLTPFLADLKTQAANVRKSLTGLQNDGISRQRARMMVLVGFLLMPIGGWFFSIFTMKASFSSKDIFFYLFNGLQDISHHGNSRDHIIQWLQILGLIVLTAILARSLIIHVKRRSSEAELEKELEDYRVELKVESEKFRFSSRFRSGNGLLFWLKILPLLLTAGILVILLAAGDTYSANLRLLEDSLPGLGAGSGICLGLGALVFLYVTKILPRSGQEEVAGRHRRWIIHWAIPMVFLIFLICLLMAMFHFSALKEEGLGIRDSMVLALALFIPCSLLSAFSLGFGMHYLSVQELNDELDAKIIYYEETIERYKSPIRLTPNRQLGADIDNLLQGLLQQVRRKNNRLFRNDITINSGLVKVPGEEISKGKRYLLLFTLFVQETWSMILTKVKDLILPDENSRQTPAVRPDIPLRIFKSFQPWEAELFPDLYEKMKIYEEEMKYLREKIQEKNGEIKDLQDPSKAPLKDIHEAMERLLKEIDACKKEIATIKIAAGKARANMRYRCQGALLELNRGYILKEIFLKSGLDQLFVQPFSGQDDIILTN